MIMIRTFPLIPALGAAALLLAVGVGLAQSRGDQTQLTGARPEGAGDVRAVEGKVVELERRTDTVTLLKLDNGTSLQVAAASAGPGQAVQVGDSIIARYEEEGRPDKVATLVRVIEMQAP
jgi:hypothetical protein